MFGALGVLLALALIIVLALRGVNILIASLVCAVVVAATNGMSIATALGQDFTQSMMGFAGRFLLLFLTGAIFGRVMAESKAAESLAYALSRKLGHNRAVLIIVTATSLLTYGGVNAFVVVLTLYPLGLGLVHRANVPKRLLMGGVVLGAATFTMTAMPGSPSIHNNIAANALGTSLTAAPVLGLLASAVMFGLGIAYLEWERRKAQRRSEGFVAGPNDVISEESPEASAMPHWLTASLPLLIVVAVILIPGWLHKLLGVGAGNPSGFLRLLAFTQKQPILWTCAALVIAICSALVLFRRHLTEPRLTLGRGAENAAQPLLNTAAVIGFGGVVSKTAVFASFANMMLDADLHPLVSAIISINIVSGIAGSASGALGIWLPSFAQHYLDAGVPPEILHRVLIVASGAFDTLPHCGAIITCLTVMGLTHREAYKDAAVVTILIPLGATALITALAIYL